MLKTQRWKRRGSAGEQEAEPAEVADAEPDLSDDDEPDGPPERLRLRDTAPVLLVRAAHPRQALLTALFLGAAAALSGRPGREVGVVFATVLVGQVILGWHNDLVDRGRDERHETPGKPLADGRLDPGTAWFVLICAVLVVVPLSITSGITAGAAYLISVAVGLLGNLVLRKGFLSWLPWAVAFGLYPAYLSYGGWGGEFEGDPPQLLMTVLFALLGIGVHFLRALWGLVADNEDGWTYLPLKLGLRLGATKLLVLSGLYTSVVLVLIAFAATYSGLAQ